MAHCLIYRLFFCFLRFAFVAHDTDISVHSGTPVEAHKGLVNKVSHMEALLTHEEWKYILTRFTFATDEMQVPSPTAPTSWPLVLRAFPDGSSHCIPI